MAGEGNKEGQVKPDAVPEDFADYASFRDTLDAQGSSSDSAPDAGQPATGGDGKSADEKPGIPPKGEVGDGESEEKPGEPLPEWVKRRFDREKRKIKREYDEKFAKELKALKGISNKQEAPADEPSDAEPDGEDQMPMPSIYQKAYGENWESKYDEDVNLFLDEKEMKHYPSGDSQEEETEAEPEDEAEDYEAEDDGEDLVNDLQEVLEDGSEEEEDLWTDFKELMEASKVRVSEVMLKWLASEDEKTLGVSRAFIKRPILSRRIFRLPESQQVKAMEALLSSGQQGKTANESGISVLGELRGTGSPQTNQARQISLAAEDSHDAYTRERERLATA